MYKYFMCITILQLTTRRRCPENSKTRISVCRACSKIQTAAHYYLQTRLVLRISLRVFQPAVTAARGAATKSLSLLCHTGLESGAVYVRQQNQYSRAVVCFLFCNSTKHTSLKTKLRLQRQAWWLAFEILCKYRRHVRSTYDPGSMVSQNQSNAGGSIATRNYA